jgi:hypothetical protein
VEAINEHEILVKRFEKRSKCLGPRSGREECVALDFKEMGS